MSYSAQFFESNRDFIQTDGGSFPFLSELSYCAQYLENK